MAARDIQDVLRVFEPDGPDTPLVYDSPHSGRTFPPGFRSLVTVEQLRSAEDAFVDELVSNCTGFGIPLLAAYFPRAFIDANRGLDEIDTALLSEPWPDPVRDSEKVQAGMGLVRRDILPGVPLYTELLPVAEIRWRIDTFWRPYHEALEELIDGAHARHGAVWHVNWHSMKSVGNAMNSDAGAARPDFVVGDRDGTSCAASFTETAVSALRELGYRVAVNQPYKGAELVRRHGRPSEQRHSLQIEINRALYMDETRFRKTSGFDRLRGDLTDLTECLAEFVAEVMPSKGRRHGARRRCV